MLAADVLTLGWVGMWLGLTARNLNRAILGAIGRVLILPWGAFFTTMFAIEFLWRLSGRGPFEPGQDLPLYIWFGIGLAVNCVFGVWWARRHLLRDFREAATQRYQAGKIDWFRRRSRGEDVAPIPDAAAHRQA